MVRRRVLALTIAVFVAVAIAAVSGQREEYIILRSAETIPTPLNFTRSNVNDIDDSPYQCLPFPWNFPFFGVPQAGVCLSPNGGLHFGLHRPPNACITGDSYSFSAPPACTLNSIGYDACIAVLITDLYPGVTYSGNPTPFVGYTSAPCPFPYGANATSPTGVGLTCFYARWQTVPLYFSLDQLSETRNTMTFMAVLYPNGRVDISYEHVYDPYLVDGWTCNFFGCCTAACNPRTWIVGMRPPNFASQAVENWADWLDIVSVPSVYDARASIVSNSTHRWWPLSPVSCMTPSVGAIGTNTTRLSFYVDHSLVPNLGPASGFVFTCRFYIASLATAGIKSIPDATRNRTIALPPYTPNSSATIDPALYNSTFRLQFGVDTPAVYNTSGDDTLQCHTPSGGSLIAGLTLRVFVLESGFELPFRAQRDSTANPTLIPAGLTGTGQHLFTYLQRVDDRLNRTAEARACMDCTKLARFAGKCPLDCAGELLGRSVIDACGACSFGSNTFSPFRDCDGTCFGPFTRDVANGNQCVCSAQVNASCVTRPESLVGPFTLAFNSWQYLYSIAPTASLLPPPTASTVGGIPVPAYELSAIHFTSLPYTVNETTVTAPAKPPTHRIEYVNTTIEVSETSVVCVNTTFEVEIMDPMNETLLINSTLVNTTCTDVITTYNITNTTAVTVSNDDGVPANTTSYAVFRLDDAIRDLLNATRLRTFVPDRMERLAFDASSAREFVAIDLLNAFGGSVSSPSGSGSTNRWIRTPLSDAGHNNAPQPLTQSVVLPFCMRFYDTDSCAGGGTSTTVQLTSTGAIVVGSAVLSPACIADGAATLFASTPLTTSCRYTVIAASLADYDLSVPLAMEAAIAAGTVNGTVPPVSNIHYIVTANVFSVRYELSSARGPVPPLAASASVLENVNHTFQVSIFDSGKIVVSYTNITDPASESPCAAQAAGTADAINAASVDCVHHWLVGLSTATATNPPPSVASVPYYSSRDVLLSQYLNRTQYPLSTPLPSAVDGMPLEGTFVPRAYVRSGTTIQYQSFGRVFCLTPKIGPSTGHTRVRIMSDRLSAAAMASTIDLSLTVEFGQTVVVPAWYNGTLNMIEFDTPAGAVDTTVRVVLKRGGLKIATNGLYFTYLAVSNSAFANGKLTALQAPHAACAECVGISPAFNTEYCVLDCASYYGGSAARDACGICLNANGGTPVNAPNGCINNSTCINHPASGGGASQYATCDCRPGWSGQFCQSDINECASLPCFDYETCHDHLNGFNCTCPAGYSGVFCQTNINECASAPCQNGGTCTDHVDGFNCTCTDGWAGRTCNSDINECASFPCQNNGTCVDGYASFTCQCAGGFTGRVCSSDIDECLSFPCLHNGSCIDRPNGFTCACTGGYSGVTCEICPDGFTGALCQTEIDECTSAPCRNGGTCTDAVAGFTCACAAGWSGPTCNTDINECSSRPCQNGGTCFDRVAGYNCTCSVGFTGRTCATNIDECASRPCQNNATCVDAVNGFTCGCRPGFVGARCQTQANECLSNPCQMGGTCHDVLGGYTCDCIVGLSGPRCQTVINYCASNPCVHGTCVPALNSWSCQCQPGWEGTNCGIAREACWSSPCANGGTCVTNNNGGSYMCVCPSYVGGSSGLARNVSCDTPCFAPFATLPGTGMCACLASAPACLATADIPIGVPTTVLQTYARTYVTLVVAATTPIVTALPVRPVTRSTVRGTASAAAVSMTARPTPAAVADDLSSTAFWIDPTTVTASNGWNRSANATYSDGRFHEVGLNFTFQYFATPTRRVWLNQDGAIYLSRSNLPDRCVSNGARELFANSTACRFRVIGGSVTNYGSPPLDSPTAGVWYRLTSTGLSVVYRDMPLANAPPGADTHSFGIHIPAAGTSIRFEYYSVYDPIDTPNIAGSAAAATRNWFVGCRQDGNAAFVHPFGGSPLHLSDWFTYNTNATGLVPVPVVGNEIARVLNAIPKYVAGVYPARAAFRTTTRPIVTLCRASPFFCNTPSSGPPAGGTVIRFSTNDWSCFLSPSSTVPLVAVLCDFGGVLRDAVYSATDLSIRCSSPPGVSGTYVPVRLRVKSTLAVIESNAFYFLYLSPADARGTPAALATAQTLAASCNACGWARSGVCVTDCAGTLFGNATVDSCFVCSGGETRIIPNSVRDCAGICFGPYQSKAVLNDDGTTGSQCSCSTTTTASSSAAAVANAKLCESFQLLDGPLGTVVVTDTFNDFQVPLIILISLAIGMQLAIAAVLARRKYVSWQLDRADPSRVERRNRLRAYEAAIAAHEAANGAGAGAAGGVGPGARNRPRPPAEAPRPAAEPVLSDEDRDLQQAIALSRAEAMRSAARSEAAAIAASTGGRAATSPRAGNGGRSSLALAIVPSSSAAAPVGVAGGGSPRPARSSPANASATAAARASGALPSSPVHRISTSSSPVLRPATLSNPAAAPAAVVTPSGMVIAPLAPEGVISAAPRGSATTAPSSKPSSATDSVMTTTLLGSAPPPLPALPNSVMPANASAVAPVLSPRNAAAAASSSSPRGAPSVVLAGMPALPVLALPPSSPTAATAAAAAAPAVNPTSPHMAGLGTSRNAPHFPGEARTLRDPIPTRTVSSPPARTGNWPEHYPPRSPLAEAGVDPTSPPPAGARVVAGLAPLPLLSTPALRTANASAAGVTSPSFASGTVARLPSRLPPITNSSGSSAGGAAAAAAASSSSSAPASSGSGTINNNSGGGISGGTRLSVPPALLAPPPFWSVPPPSSPALSAPPPLPALPPGLVVSASAMQNDAELQLEVSGSLKSIAFASPNATATVTASVKAAVASATAAAATTASDTKSTTPTAGSAVATIGTHTVHCLFAVPFAPPPVTATATATATASAASASDFATVYVALCLPHGYAVVLPIDAARLTASKSLAVSDFRWPPAAGGGGGGAGEPAFYVSLHNLLLKLSPAYYNAFQSSLEARVAALAAERANETGSDDDDAARDGDGGDDDRSDDDPATNGAEPDS